MSRWDRLLIFGACNVAALICFIICFSLLFVLTLAFRKFAILYVYTPPLYYTRTYTHPYPLRPSLPGSRKGNLVGYIDRWGNDLRRTVYRNRFLRLG